MGSESTLTSKDSVLSSAISWRNRVIAAEANNSGDGIADDFPSLDVKALDFCQGIANELCDDGKDFSSVDSEARTVEGLCAQTVRVEIASVWVASSCITSGRVCSSTSITRTLCLRLSRTRMWGQRSRDGVCLPDVHFRAARTVVTNTGVDIV